MHLQGPETDRKAVDEIRQAVQQEAETTVRLLNYRKNGEPFWNMFTIAPMADAGGKNRFFIGIQVLLNPISHQVISARLPFFFSLLQLQCEANLGLEVLPRTFFVCKVVMACQDLRRTRMDRIF